ncbi:nitroreductase family protein [Altererythrobacter sp. CC-YST694]|uniref:nitroreductase family protein n=1 Tax=Altererythrobacter sp. CC-YST694 TaxID=2755038 RepID=UPI001D033A3E|nr:nitroreductase family protein [Altererythrobacter sp. CC-YST694]MCB5425826.1 nitroreductase family protein [Altererythrobacter sp. CC-YST694]
MKLSNIPAQIGKLSLFITEYAQDMALYARYCGISPMQKGRKKAFYKIMIETHAIEKGLSLANPRHLFGREKINHIMRMVRSYGIGSDEIPVTMAVGALETYLQRHRDLGLADPLLDAIEAFLAERKAASAAGGTGGLRFFPEGKPAVAPEPAGLLLNRFSCRMFEKAPLDRGKIADIVHLAQTAPSQCNRQATRLHYYDDPAKVRELLALQGGSAGFLDDVPGLFVVAFDLAAWGGAQQRNQGYVDGSLFAMTLMLAAQAHGAVTCPLNLAIRHSTERRIKAAGGIPGDQRLVMMIAIGTAQAHDLKAAASPRRETSEVLDFASGHAAADVVPA